VAAVARLYDDPSDQIALITYLRQHLRLAATLDSTVALCLVRQSEGVDHGISGHNSASADFLSR
jgi:hypothetical protein